MSKIVNRTLDFFELFADQGRPLSLSEIANILQIPMSSCHDVLTALQERGYVYELTPRSGYYASLKLQEVATRIVANDPIIPRAEVALREVRNRLDDSVLLSRVDGRKASYLLVLEPSYPLRFLRRVGDRTGVLHATSVGKALLGSLDEQTCRRVISKLDMPKLTENTIQSRDELLRQIETSRKRGYYVSIEESEPGATTVSRPLRWNKSTLIVTVAGPRHRVEPRIPEIAEELAAVCTELEAPGQAAGHLRTGG